MNRYKKTGEFTRRGQVGTEDKNRDEDRALKKV